MNKINSFLRDYGWIFLVTSVLIWIFWAPQLYKPIIKLFKEEAAHQERRDARKDMENERKMVALIDGMIAVAEAKGNQYGPYDYFADLELIYKKKKDYGEPVLFQTHIGRLQVFSMNNVAKVYFTETDIERAREIFEATVVGKAIKDERDESARGFMPNGWRSFIDWLIVLYCRSIPLAFILYLVRMAEWMGILETFLADKRKFLLAILGWPFYILKYPSNVLREIRVEAELRRMGDIFRRLSRSEKLAVRRVANSDYYHQWLYQFHRRHESVLQTSFLAALLVTVLFRCFQPVADAGAYHFSNSGNDPPICSIGVSVDDNDSQFDDQNDNIAETVPSETLRLKIIVLFQRIWRLLKTLHRKIIIKEIGHIPLFWLSGFDFNLIILTE